MIQVNLVPGAAKKRATRRMPQIGALGSLPSFKALPKLDRLTLFAVVTWLTMIPLTGYMFVSARSRVKELNVSIEGALADSTKYANIIAANKKLIERRDTIAQKVNIIQKIDANRYVWAHIMDEVSRSLPPYTWLMKIETQPLDSTETGPKFRIEGRTGNNFALTKYLQDLEASPFIKNVKLQATELVRENEKLVYSFVLEASYEEPPPDVIETVPLFSKEPE
jgi:Tfp pilus assembly protein PilN